jgi:hypothetical protein
MVETHHEDFGKREVNEKLEVHCTSGQARCSAFVNDMSKHRLCSEYRYLQLSVSPPCSDPLTLRKSLQDSLLPSFGITSSIYLDILWIAETGLEAVIRVKEACVHLTQ